MDDTYRNSLLEVSGYKLERRDRNTGGGGVISYIRSYIQARRRKELESNWLDHQNMKDQEFSQNLTNTRDKCLIKYDN